MSERSYPATPMGRAAIAPFRDPRELLATLTAAIELRVGAHLLAIGAPLDGAATRAIVARGLGDDPASWRAAADRHAAAIDHRLGVDAADAAPLALACSRLGLPWETVAALLAFELAPAASALLRLASDPDGGRAGLRVAGLAAARRDGDPARALDDVQRLLVPPGLATIADHDEPAFRWTVRAAPRWLPLAAGRLALDDELHAVRLADAAPLAADHPRRAALLGAAAPRRAGTPPPIIADDAATAAAALAARDTPALVVDGPVDAIVLVREARLLGAGVVVAAGSPIRSVLSATDLPLVIVR